MRSADANLLAALRESLAGRQKQVAFDVWPDAPDAEARMSRVLAGGLSIPARLIDLALAGAGGERLLAYFAARQAGDPAAIRREVLGELVQLRGQLEFAFERLEQAERAEQQRAAMARVSPVPDPRRRRA